MHCAQAQQQAHKMCCVISRTSTSNRHIDSFRGIIFLLEADFAHPTMDSSGHLVEDLAILNSVLTQSFGQLLNSEYALSGIQNLAVTCY